jgi:hypothetical protein
VLEEVLEVVEEPLVDLEAVVEDLEAVAEDLAVEVDLADVVALVVEVDLTVEVDLVVFMLAMLTEDVALEAVHSSDVLLDLVELLACFRGRHIDHTMIIRSITEPSYLNQNY